MPIVFLERALQDLKNNFFLHLVTMITIALSALIVSTFLLFLTNANALMSSWQQGVRIMVYIEDQVARPEIDHLKDEIRQMDGVTEIRFISKAEALQNLKKRMQGQASLFDNLRTNPLPNAFQVRLDPTRKNWREIEMLAIHIESSHLVADVEYGQNWLKRFTGLLTLFRLTAIMMCAVFFMASVFIVGNTIRLLFYSKNEEIRIMRLVGATDKFIKMPYYLEGLIQGALGGLAGIILLLLAFSLMSSSIDLSFTSYFFNLRFLSLFMCSMIIAGCMMAGWLGCYISLKQFLNE